MTKVVFTRSLGNLVGFNISGHAGFAEENEDIVCSAISAISLTIVNGITEILKIDIDCKVHDGFLSADLQNLSSEETDRCQVLLETMLLGLENIKINYSDHIEIEIEEV
jgi:uncharacterized protein YsxB (DUF464 family)